MGLKSIPRGSKSKAPETVAPGPATAIAPLHYRRASRHTNAESYVMALDQGTTSSRAIIFDRHGGVKAIAQKEFEPQMPGARVTELRKGWRRALRAAEAWAE